jgi:glycosyltransferase involved in cell wall biosynthesis
VTIEIAFTATKDPTSLRSWSGTPWHMLQGFVAHGADVQPIAPLRESWGLAFKTLQLVRGRVGTSRYHREREPLIVRGYANQIKATLRSSTQVIFSPGSIAISLLDVGQPIVIWTDATIPIMLDYYGEFTNLSSRALRNAVAMETEAMSRTSLFVSASEWAASSARRDYGLHPDRVMVVPFGASLCGRQVANTVEEDVARRFARSERRLLLIGVDWLRKGVDVAIDAVDALRARGLDVSLDVVGCAPPRGLAVPDHVRVHGFVDKLTDAGWRTLAQLFRGADLFLLPTRAECFGTVLCEAAAFGVPSIVPATGGIRSAVEDGTSGLLVATDAIGEEYAETAHALLGDPERYRHMAIEARRLYEQRWNWRTATAKVLDRMRTLQPLT